MNIDRYLKFDLTFFVFLWIGLIHSAQSGMAQNHQDISLSTGLQRLGGIDLGYSPLKYAGLRSVISLNYDQEVPNRTASLSLNFAQGVGTSRGGNSLDSWSVNLMSQTFYHPGSTNRKILFGWSLQNEFNQRKHQSFSNFNHRMDYFSSVGPALGFFLPISWADHKLRWKTTAHVQGLGAKFASDFISSEPRMIALRGKDGEGVWQSADVFLIGEDWSFGCWSEIRYESCTGNSFAVQHQFDFQQLSVAQQVIRVRNSLFLNISVRL